MANANPSPATRFGAGNRANPSGKTSAQRSCEYRNAEAATLIRERLLNALAASLAEAPDNAAVLEHLTPATLKLLKDAEDRGLGAPAQTLGHTTNGKDLPGAVDLSKLSNEALAELVAAADSERQVSAALS